MAERTRKPAGEEAELKSEEKIRWTKKGGGSFWLNGHIIKPGQIFYATLSEVPEAFRDQCIPTDGIPTEPRKQVKGITATYEIEEIAETAEEDGGPFYNVINSTTRKAVNGKPLTSAAAGTLLKNLAE